LDVTADVGVAHQVELEVSNRLTFFDEVATSDGERHLNFGALLGLEVGNLLDGQQLSGRLVAYDDPPFFKFASREILSDDRLFKVSVFLGVLGFLILVSISDDLDNEINCISCFELAVLGSSKVREVVIEVDEGVAIADLSQLLHLLLSPGEKLLAYVVFHVHEIGDLFNSSILLEHLYRVSVESWKLEQGALFAPHGLHNHLRELHGQESSLKEAISADDVDHSMHQFDCLLQHKV